MKKLNRRAFLKLAVAAAAGIVASQMPDIKPVKEARPEVAHAVTYDDIQAMLDRFYRRERIEYRLSWWERQGLDNRRGWVPRSAPWSPGQFVHIDVDGEVHLFPVHDSIGVTGIVK